MSRIRTTAALTAAASIITVCAFTIGASVANAADSVKIRLSYVAAYGSCL